MKFIYVINKDDKMELLSRGYNFICEQKISNKIVYVFENNINDEKSTFNNHGECRFFYSNEMYL